MNRRVVTTHVLASQAIYAAKMAGARTPSEYRTEVLRQLHQLGAGLADWELDRVLEEIEARLAVTSP